MRKYTYICLLINFLAITFATDCYAIVYQDNTGNIGTLNLSDNAIIRNYGNIDDIYTNNNYLKIYNYGTIGTVHNSGFSFVCQYIPSNDALHKINMDGTDFQVDIQNIDKVDLNVLKNIVSDVDGEINITNSSIVINDFADWRSWNQNVSLIGTNTLYITNVDTIVSGEEILHVSDNGTHVVLMESDKLHKVSLKYDSISKVAFIYISEEKDYEKVFDDNRGSLLQDLRESSSNSNLLNAMDNANNMQELENIMQSSYHFNPSILMRPVNMINEFSMLPMLSYSNALYGGLSGVYMFSDTTNLFGINFNINGDYDGTYLSIDFNLNKFKYVDDMNDFSGLVYGGNIKIKKYIDNLWANIIAGISLANFKADAVYHDDMITNNPFGYSLYGGIDVGYDYKIVQDLIVSPFIGTSLMKSEIVDISQTDTNIRIGGNLKYSFVVDNVEYDYDVMGGCGVNGNIFGGVKIGFVSILDSAGMSLGFNVYKDEYDINYKADISGKILF